MFTALVYNWLCHQIPTFFDSNFYFNEGNIVFGALKESPIYYLQLVLGPNNFFPEPEHLCSYIDKMGLWYDNTGYTIVRINALIRLFSFGFISIHFLFFSFLSFIGSFYLFKFFSQTSDLNDISILGVLFFFPSILFWSSGIHKEALVIFAVGILLYNFYLLTQRFNYLNFLMAIIAFLFIINIRMYLILVLLPALVAYYWNAKSRIVSFWPYFISYLTLLIVVVIYDMNVENSYRMAKKIAEFQKSFISSHGNTSFEMDFTGNSWTNILVRLPENFVNGFIYPLYNQCRLDWCILASVESIIICGIILISLFKIKYKYIFNNNLALFCLSIGFSLMLIIGIVVNNAGAIVRYRIFALIFIFMGLLLSFNKVSKIQ